MFFLSDGKFNTPKPSGFFDGEALNAKTVVERSNPGNVPVHSIAFEEPSSRKNMNEISIMTGGDFRYVYSSGRTTGRRVSSTGPRDPFATTSASKNDPLAEQKALKWMGYADDMEAINNKRMAEYYYTKIILDFPDTNAAQEARRRQAVRKDK